MSIAAFPAASLRCAPEGGSSTACAVTTLLRQGRLHANRSNTNFLRDETAATYEWLLTPVQQGISTEGSSRENSIEQMLLTPTLPST